MSSRRAAAGWVLAASALLALPCAAAEAPAPAASAPAAPPADRDARGLPLGGGNNLWVVAQNPKGEWGVFHAAGPKGAAAQLATCTPDTAILGRPLVAGRGEGFTLAEREADGRLLFERVRAHWTVEGPQLSHQRVWALPPEVRVHALADAGPTLWAVLEGWKPEMVQEAGRLSPPTALETALNLPGGTLAPKPEKTPAKPEETPAAAPAGLQLLAHRAQGTERVEWPLPPAADAQVALAVRGEALLALIRQGGRLQSFERGAEGAWEPVQAAVDWPGDLRQTRLAAMAGEWVLAEALTPQRARLFVLRGGRWLPAGQVEAPLSGGWGLVEAESGAALAVCPHPIQPGGNMLTLFPVSLRGDTAAPQTVKLGANIDPWVFWVKNVQLLVMVSSVVVMFLTWGQVRQQPRLPAGLAVAGFARRLLAGALDLAPAVLLSAKLTGSAPAQVLHGWALMSTGFGAGDLPPAVLAALLFLVHVTLGELVFGRSLGKWALGLRVVTLDGARPPFNRLLLRNLLKLFEVMAPVLVTFALFPPAHQRLGDRVAGTLVARTLKP